MPQAQFVEGDTVVAFRPLPSRAPRPALADDAERGRLLLFTGVRYQRLAGDCEEDALETPFSPRRGCRLLLIRLLALLAVPVLAGCVERGDFGRVKRHSAWNDAVRTTGSLAAGLRGEAASPFLLTDDESELRDRAWRFLVPAHERAWLETALADLVATRVLPPGAGIADVATYHAALTGGDARSPASRYRRLSEDAAADARLLPALAELARRVAVADAIRLKTLAHATLVSSHDIRDAHARVAENRCLIAWVARGLEARLAGYRFALEHMVIEAPQADAVPAERSLARLQAAQASLGGIETARLPLAACADEAGPAPIAVISSRG